MPNSTRRRTRTDFVGDPSDRQSPLGQRGSPTRRRSLSGRVREVKFGTVPTRLCRWSVLVVSFPKSTTRTGPDTTRPYMSALATRFPTKSGPCQIPLHGPRGLCVPTRPDPQTKFTHVEIERTSLRPEKKSADLSETRAVCGSGLVGSV